jgi:hypothetical protein
MRTAKWMVLFCLGFGLVARAEPTLQLRVSTPMIVSGAAGLRFGPPDGRYQPALEVEAGVGGGRVAVGLDNHGAGSFGYGIKGALLRTWIEPIGVDENQSFLGVEGEWSIKRMIFSLGGYRRISAGDDDWLASAGIAIRF